MQISRENTYNIRTATNVFRINQSQQFNKISAPIRNLMNKSYDRLDISSRGKELYIDSIAKKSPQLSFTNTDMKVESLSNQEEEIDAKDIFIKMSLEHKKQLEKVKKSDLSDEEKSNKIESMTASFEKEIEKTVENIALDIKNHFDKGKDRLKEYSSDELEDLIDIEKFTSNLKSKTSELSDMILDSPYLNNVSQIRSVFSRKESSALEIEDMTLSDVEVLHEFINTYEYEKADQSIYNAGGLLSLKENDINEAIEMLSLSDDVKIAMYRNNERVSEAVMREKTFNDEEKKYNENLKSINKKLEMAKKRVELLEERLMYVKDEYGIDPRNKLLMKTLASENVVLDNYKSVEDEKKEIINNFLELSSNKERVIGFDFYKRMKVSYDETKKVMYEEDEDYEGKYIIKGK